MQFRYPITAKRRQLWATRRVVIQREESELTSMTPLSLNTKQRRSRAAQDNLALDNAFVLIEGHPPFTIRG